MTHLHSKRLTTSNGGEANTELLNQLSIVLDSMRALCS